jgi:hypothetical protein
MCYLTGQALHRDFQCRRDWNFPVPASLEVLPGGPARNLAAFPLTVVAEMGGLEIQALRGELTGLTSPPARRGRIPFRRRAA